MAPSKQGADRRGSLRHARRIRVNAPPRSFDASGRALPLSPEEIDQCAALALQALDSLEDLGDEEEQRETFAYLARAVNEDRLSDRPRFGS